jgi:hypothetical protein
MTRSTQTGGREDKALKKDRWADGDNRPSPGLYCTLVEWNSGDQSLASDFMSAIGSAAQVNDTQRL